MNAAHKRTNRLIQESSPYLLQHAYNPVDWYPWGEEALQRAKAEDKPILVSIGYSSCHWCHVMERESFENEETAAIMNQHFINIKIDREERPDLDHIYMDAVQAMTGSGGWPLNVFLTPELKPFYGGTYFPPVKAYNRASWKDVLYGVASAFKERRHEIESQAENLTAHLQNSNSFGISQPSSVDIPFEEKFTKQQQELIFENIMKTADRTWGGFGRAPKFPSTFVIQFLLRHYHFTKNEEALQQTCLSLDKMIYGGIYDHIGGGFARYSTDTEWLVPHFEKMLYDNALLVSVLSEACQLTGKKLYKDTIIQTLNFIKREFTSEEGGFYAALDADSEGEEGKYYVWQKAEVESLLGEEAAIFCAYYDITEEGNWEEKNIPRVLKPLEEFAEENNISAEALEEQLSMGRAKLLAERNKRVRPGLDDKILLGWNALMNTALSKAYAATGLEEYRSMAIRNMDFLLQKFSSGDELLHTYKNGKARIAAFLDDYAYLIEALIHLQEISGNQDYLLRAFKLTGKVISDFSEEGSPFFFYTSNQQTGVIVRKKELYDGAVPSGNASMAFCLHYLGMVFDKKDWTGRAVSMLESVSPVATRYPGSFAIWARMMQQLLNGTNEIALTGKGFQQKLPLVLSYYIPNRILQGTDIKREDFPLLRGKETGEQILHWLCKDYACFAPVRDFTELLSKLN